MQIKTPIFVVSVILLVPFVYGFSIIPDVCAAAQHPRYQTGNCTGSQDTGMTCCWREPIEGSILGQKYCQTCTTTYDPKTKLHTEVCTSPTKQASANDPSGSLPDLNQDLTTERLPGGGVFKAPDTNNAIQEESQNTTNLARDGLSEEDMGEIVDRMKNSSKSPE